jgi:DNA-binding LytR/AlgR family response regulator
LLRIGIDDIVYFEADGNLTNIVTANKLKGTVNMNLGKMEQFLLLNFTQRASTFLRVGKRFIINMSHIYLINVPKQKLVLSDYRTFTFQLPVSKDALRKVKELVLINKM